MGELSIYHWLLVLLVLVLLFGGRKIPELMRGLGSGIRSFKEGLAGAKLRTKPNDAGTEKAAAELPKQLT